MMVTIFKFIALTSAGLLSGAFMYGFLNVVPTFHEVPVTVHLVYRTQLMKHNSITMQLLMALSIITPLFYSALCWNIKLTRNFSMLSASFAIVTLLVTRLGNVPVNQLIKTWQADNLPGNWQQLLHRWDIFNAVRTATSLACFVSLIFATHFNAATPSNGLNPACNNHPR